jgi:hypothetical protein
MPTITLPFPVTVLLLDDVSLAQQSSVFRNGQSQVANGGGATVQMLLLGPGVWDVTVHGSYRANYTSTHSGPPDGRVRFFLDSVFADVLCFWANGPAAPLVETITYRIGIRTPMRIERVLGSNTVAQDHALFISVLADRLA